MPDQKDELIQCQQTPEGKTLLKKQRNPIIPKKRKGDNKEGDKDTDSGGNWKRKFKKAMKTPNGLSHIMSVLMSEEQNNATIASVFQPQQQPQQPILPPSSQLKPVVPPGQSPQQAKISQLAAAFPDLATRVQLQSILNKVN